MKSYYEWVCINCWHRFVYQSVIVPMGWFSIQWDGGEVEVCSLKCLNEVAHNWLESRRPIEKEG